MGIGKVNANIHRALQDNTLTKAEAEKITSKKDPIFSAPESVGDFVDKDEYAAIKNLYGKVVSGEVKADAEATFALKHFLANGPDDRMKHVLKNTLYGQGIGTAIGANVGTLIGGVGTAPGAWGGFRLGSMLGTAYGLEDD